MARSRLTRQPLVWPVSQEGSIAGYVSIQVPYMFNEPLGFQYQVQRKVDGSSVWDIMAVGVIRSLNPLFDTALYS